MHPTIEHLQKWAPDGNSNWGSLPKGRGQERQPDGREAEILRWLYDLQRAPFTESRDRDLGQFVWTFVGNWEESVRAWATERQINPSTRTPPTRVLVEEGSLGVGKTLAGDQIREYIRLAAEKIKRGTGIEPNLVFWAWDQVEDILKGIRAVSPPGGLPYSDQVLGMVASAIQNQMLVALTQDKPATFVFIEKPGGVTGVKLPDGSWVVRRKFGSQIVDSLARGHAPFYPGVVSPNSFVLGSIGIEAGPGLTLLAYYREAINYAQNLEAANYINRVFGRKEFGSEQEWRTAIGGGTVSQVRFTQQANREIIGEVLQSARPANLPEWVVKGLREPGAILSKATARELGRLPYLSDYVSLRGSVGEAMANEEQMTEAVMRIATNVGRITRTPPREVLRDICTNLAGGAIMGEAYQRMHLALRARRGVNLGDRQIVVLNDPKMEEQTKKWRQISAFIRRTKWFNNRGQEQ
jgi:hypothetical protein